VEGGGRSWGRWKRVDAHVSFLILFNVEQRGGGGAWHARLMVCMNLLGVMVDGSACSAFTSASSLSSDTCLATNCCSNKTTIAARTTYGLQSCKEIEGTEQCCSQDDRGYRWPASHPTLLSSSDRGLSRTAVCSTAWADCPQQDTTFKDFVVPMVGFTV